MSADLAARWGRVYSDYERSESYHETSGIGAAIDVLAATATPDFRLDPRSGGIDRVDEFVHCIAAIENFIMPAELGKSETGNKIFGRRAAALTGVEIPQLASHAENFSETYRLRSKLIHGTASTASLDETARERLLVARPMLSLLVRVVMKLQLDSGSSENVPDLCSRLEVKV